MKTALEGVGKGLSFLTNNKYFWYFILGVMTYFGYKRLTKPAEETFLDSPIPNAGKDIPTGWKPDTIVTKFHDYYLAWFGDSDVLHQCYILSNALSDGQFVVMVKTYNAKYAKADGNKTLWTRSKGWNRIIFGWGTTDQDKFYLRMQTLKQDY